MTVEPGTDFSGDAAVLAHSGAEALVSAMSGADWARIADQTVDLLGGEDPRLRTTARELLDADRGDVLDGRGRSVCDRWWLFLLGHLDEHPEAATELGRIIRAVTTPVATT